MSGAPLKTAGPPNPGQGPMVDVPRVLLSEKLESLTSARIITTEEGVLSGCEEMAAQAGALGLRTRLETASGDQVTAGTTVACLEGNPLQIIKGEDRLLGELGKASGVATAARRALQAAKGLKVVCGAWKKVPLEMKHRLRAALQHGGMAPRILDDPFVYLDKNYLRILGSVPEALRAAARFPERSVVLQVRGETAPLATEVRQAAELGARVIMVDTGELADARTCAAVLCRCGLREKVQIAFAGGIGLDDLPRLAEEDLDIVDLGRAIIDAPLLDLRYELPLAEKPA